MLISDHRLERNSKSSITIIAHNNHDQVEEDDQPDLDMFVSVGHRSITNIIDTILPK